MKKLVVSFILVSSLAKVNIAETVSPERALSVATSFFSSSANSQNQRGNLELELVHTENLNAAKAAKPEPAYYVFSNPEGAGFVIIAGDDEIEPVIGYSFENKMDVNNLPPGFVSYMYGIKLSIEAAKKNPAGMLSEAKAKWNAGYYSRSVTATPVVGSLVKALWGQGSPYNDECPITSNFERTIVGCVAVAMGQIMQYWNYPEKGTGKRNGIDFGNTTYNWSKMRFSLNSSSAKDEKFAVAQLLRHCGASVDMDYGVKESGANPSPQAFENYFGYDKSARLVHKYNYSTDEWIQLLKDQLDDFKPVLYSGFAVKKMILGWPKYEKGHAWVCDGYDSDNKFHMNWGWNGSSADGYYIISDLKPKSDEFRYINDAIIDLVKPKRLELSSISTTKGIICSQTSFVCSVTDNAKIVAYLWTVPKGWKVSGVVSNGLPISLGNKVTIEPSSTGVSVQSEVRIEVRGLTSYGERTLSKYIHIGTGKPSYSHEITLFPGEEVHTFTASAASIIQHSDNGTKWVSADRVYSDQAYNTTRYIYIRASNSCGTTAATKYKLNRQIDPNDKNITAVPENVNEHASLDLFPVPATENVFIQSNEKIVALNCFNAMGQTVEVELSGQGFSVAHLPKGVYFVTMTMKNGTIEKGKFIKE